jgi:predicted phosphohydrolase
MARLSKLLIALATFAVAAGWSASPRDFELVRPRLGIPEVALAGETIRIELRDSLPFDLGGAPTVALAGEERVELQLTEVSREGATRVLEARLPATLPAGAFALEVALHGETHSHAKAVHVLERYPEDYEIVHLADLPLFLGDGRGDLLMQRIVDEVNLIAPDLVLISGDIAYAGTWAHFEAALAHFEGFDAPVIAGIGNHEYRGLASFFTLFGPLHHIVDVGPRRIITLNSGHGRDQLTESQARWMRAGFAGREGEETLVQLHHPPFWKRRLGVHVDELVELCRTHSVPVVLAGHWHGDYVFDETGEARHDTCDFEGTRYVVTTAAGADLRAPFSSSPLHHGYRLLRLSGRELLDYTYDWEGDGQRDASCSIPVGELDTSYWGPRAMVVHNQLNERFEAARLRLWIDGEVTHLRPDRGSIESVRTENGRTCYTLRVDVEPAQDTRVTLEG